MSLGSCSCRPSAGCIQACNDRSIESSIEARNAASFFWCISPSNFASIASCNAACSCARSLRRSQRFSSRRSCRRSSTRSWRRPRRCFLACFVGCFVRPNRASAAVRDRVPVLTPAFPLQGCGVVGPLATGVGRAGTAKVYEFPPPGSAAGTSPGAPRIS